MVETTAELEELQRAYNFLKVDLWERLVPCLEQLDMMVQITDNF